MISPEMSGHEDPQSFLVTRQVPPGDGRKGAILAIQETDGVTLLFRSPNGEFPLMQQRIDGKTSPELDEILRVLGRDLWRPSPN